jgi:hypothetical protein
VKGSWLDAMELLYRGMRSRGTWLLVVVANGSFSTAPRFQP